MEVILNSPHLINITNILKEIGERIEGNLMCDITPDNWIYDKMIDKIKNLQYLCKDKNALLKSA